MIFRLVQTLIFSLLYFFTYSQNCEQINDLIPIDNVQYSTLGGCTYDETGNRLFCKIGIGPDIETAETKIILANLNKSSYEELPNFDLNNYSYDHITEKFYGFKEVNGSTYFASYDLISQDFVLISQISNICGFQAGAKAFDHDKGYYYAIASLGSDCEMSSDFFTLRIDINSGSMETIDKWLGNFIYDKTSDNLIGIRSINGISYISKLDFLNNTFYDIVELTSLLGYSTASQGFDFDRGYYVFNGLKIIANTDPVEYEPATFIIDVNNGNAGYISPVDLNDYNYDPDFGFVGFHSSEGIVKSLNLSNCDLSSYSYHFTDTTFYCDISNFSTQILTSSNPISNIIGYDITVKYDPSVLTPTGNITIPSDLIDPNYVSALISDNNGEILISLALNNSAPAGTTWSGTGELFQIEFENLGTLSNGSTNIEITRMEESYLTGTESQQVAPGTVTFESDQTFQGSLIEAFSGAPLTNDITTQISGTDQNCAEDNSYQTSMLNDGTFEVDINQAGTINIIRDLDNSTDMMPVIGGDDALLIQKVLINHADILSDPPSAFAMMGMDVNMDGKVTSGDLSQVNQRTVGIIGEFAQSWNYNNDGTSNGLASLDWGFIDETDLVEPAYVISSTFPADDGSGYSKDRVPVFNLCFEVPVAGDPTCPIITDIQYHSVLIGDVNASVSSELGGGNFRTSNSTSIEVNLSESKINKDGIISIPLEFISENVINNVDLNISFDHQKLEYKGVGKISSGTIKFLDNVISSDNILFTSYSLKAYNPKKAFAHFGFKTDAKVITSEFFKGITAYSDGKEVEVAIYGEAKVNQLDELIENSWKDNIELFPIPSSSTLNISFQDSEKGIVNIHIYDIFGKVIFQQTYLKESSGFYIQRDISSFKNSLYFLEIDFHGEKFRSRFIKN